MASRSSWSERLRSFAGFLFIVATIALLAWALSQPSGQAPQAAFLGKKALNFEVPLISGSEHLELSSGGKITLADFAGKPLILNFWASWCQSCASETKTMEEFWQAHKDKIAVLGIAVQDSGEAVREFAAANGKTFPLGLDKSGRASVDYGVSGVPETFFIDARGIVRHKTSGPVDKKLLQRMLEQLSSPPSS